MRIGYSTLCFPDHSLTESIRLLQEIGFRSISIRLDAAQFDPRQCNGSREIQLNALKAVLDASTNVIVDTDARYLIDTRRAEEPHLTDTQSAERLDLVLETIEAVQQWSNPLVVFSTGPAASEDEASETMLELLAGRINRLIASIDDGDVALAIRPRPMHAVSSISNFERLLQWLEQPHRLGLAADLDTMCQNGELPIARLLSRHLDRLKVVYLTHQLSLDQWAIAEQLQASGFQGDYILWADRFAECPVSTAISEYELWRSRL